MEFILDTNRYSDMADGLAEAVSVGSRAERILVPFVVLAEIRFGIVRSSRSASNEKVLQRFLANPRVGVIYPDEQTTSYWAQICQQLRKQGTPIPENDMWIASLCLQYNLPLYSRDSHFSHVSGLLRL